MWICRWCGGEYVKVGDRVYWDSVKFKVTKLWGFSVIDGAEIISITLGKITTTVKSNELKPIKTCYAILGETGV